MKKRTSILKTLAWVILSVLVLLSVLLAVLFWPVGPGPQPSQSSSLAGYSDAVARLQAVQAGETNLNPLCKAQLLSHGQKAQTVVVLIHGYTTCPYQFRELAPQLYNHGANVLMVPLPHHGLADRMNTEQANITAEELVGYANLVVSLAHGLGEQVVVAGFSMGGVTTAWVAQNRPDVDRAVVISPAFGYTAVPTALDLPFMHLYLALPNSFAWWVPDKQEAGGPDYAYPRYASHSVAQAMRLGQMVEADARTTPLQAGSVVVVTNGNEPAVDNNAAAVAVSLWTKLSPGKVSIYEFPASLKLGHDIIDPSDSEGNTAAVYPKLIPIIEGMEIPEE
jgi:alpha-beta hydrolase superfamily lysophospholipase